MALYFLCKKHQKRRQKIQFSLNISNKHELEENKKTLKLSQRGNRTRNLTETTTLNHEKQDFSFLKFTIFFTRFH